MAEEQKKLIALVVDDEADIRESVIELLRYNFKNLVIQEATNGQEAYNRITQSRPDFMYIDVGMSIMGGCELLEKIIEDTKADPTKKPIPTIVISGEDLDTDSGKRAVELALETYTPTQLEKIKSYKPPVRWGGKHVPYLGFTSLQKPFDGMDLVARTKLLLEILESNNP